MTCGSPARTWARRVVTVYGGRAYEPQIEALRGLSDLVVGTPGRLLDLARQGHLDLSQVAGLVLDEADKMLDLGFLPDVEKILRLTPPQRQTMLFSATMPGEVVTLARRHLRRPTHIRAEHHDEPAHVPSTEQHVFRAHQMDKIEILARVLQADGRGLTIVFCRTKRACDQVADGADHPRLRRRGRPRRPRTGPAGARDARVPQRQGRRAGRDRRGRPRAGRGRRDARGQLRVPRGRQGLPAPHRPDRARRAHRRGRDLRGLGRPAALEAHRRRAGARPARAGGDLLDIRAPVQRRCGSRRMRPGRCRRPSAAGSAWRPRISRTSGRPAGTGPTPLAKQPDGAAGGPGRAAATLRETTRPVSASSGSAAGPGRG